MFVRGQFRRALEGRRRLPPDVENDVAEVSSSFHSCGVAACAELVAARNDSRAVVLARSIAILAATPDVNSKAQFTVLATLVPCTAVGMRRERACAKNVCCCYCVQYWSLGEDGDATI